MKTEMQKLQILDLAKEIYCRYKQTDLPVSKIDQYPEKIWEKLANRSLRAAEIFVEISTQFLAKK